MCWRHRLSCSGRSFTPGEQTTGHLWSTCTVPVSGWRRHPPPERNEPGGELLYVNGDTDISNTNYKLSSLAWPAERGQEKISKYAFLSKLFLRSFGLEKITFVINVMNLFPKWNLTLSTLLGANHWRGTDGDSEPSSRHLTPSFLTSGLSDTTSAQDRKTLACSSTVHIIWGEKHIHNTILTGSSLYAHTWFTSHIPWGAHVIPIL